MDPGRVSATRDSKGARLRRWTGLPRASPIALAQVRAAAAIGPRRRTPRSGRPTTGSSIAGRGPPVRAARRPRRSGREPASRTGARARGPGSAIARPMRRSPGSMPGPRHGLLPRYATVGAVVGAGDLDLLGDAEGVAGVVIVNVRRSSLLRDGGDPVRPDGDGDRPRTREGRPRLGQARPWIRVRSARGVQLADQRRRSR